MARRITMSGQDAFQWPGPPDGTVVIVDASTETERTLLESWLGSSATPQAKVVVVDLDHIGGPDAAALDQILDHDDLLVQPVRAVWLPAGGLDRSGPRLRDLVLGDPRHPNEWMARLTVRRHPERIRCVAGEPATVADLRSRHRLRTELPESFAAFVLRTASVTLDVAERQLQGRRYKVPRFVTEGILASPEFQRAVERHASDTGRARGDIVDEAQTHLAEMVAEPSSFFIDWAGKATRWIADLGYREIVVDQASVERARAVVRDHPSALLFTHKTHLDGIALMSVLYDHDFPAPHIMAGINMSFTGVGFATRRSGGIFIRRTFQDDPVYKLTLQQYLGYLMGKRFPFMWSFEGTRSRSGKLLPPRFGMLKYVVDAAHATDAEDLHLIPVSINYDLLGDVADYADQELGQAKEAESLSWFIEYLRRLRSPMGRIYLDFAEPVVLEGPVPAAVDADLPAVADQVARRANACVPVTLPALLCTVLLGTAPTALTNEQLVARMQELFDWLRAHDVRLAEGFIGDHTAIEDLADVVFEKGLVHRYDGGDESVFTITEDQHAQAGFYRNTIVHYFVDKAMVELALARIVDVEPDRRVERFWQQLDELRDLFGLEFFLTPREEFVDSVAVELRAVDPDWSTTITGSIADVEGLLRACRPIVGHSVLRPYVESYGMVADVVARLGGGETLTEDETVERALGLAEQWYLQRRISSRASIGKLMFQGAHRQTERRGLLDPAADVSIGRMEFAAELRSLGEAVARLRGLATEVSLQGTST